MDNSGKSVHVYSTGSPGEYRVGAAYTVKYMAVDSSGNIASCNFTFKVVGKKIVDVIYVSGRNVDIGQINIYEKNLNTYHPYCLKNYPEKKTKNIWKITPYCVVHTCICR